MPERLEQHHRPAIAILLQGRRTIHVFKPGRPPRAAVMRALEAARWAPNHRLTEPWRFYLLGPETAEAVAVLNAALVTAHRGEAAGAAKLSRWRRVPGWMVVTCAESEDAHRAREDYAACCCAVQNLMLSLWSEGIGTKWTTGPVTRTDRFFECIGVDPKAESVVGLFWYGYPEEVPAQQRKPVKELLFERP